MLDVPRTRETVLSLSAAAQAQNGTTIRRPYVGAIDFRIYRPSDQNGSVVPWIRHRTPAGAGGWARRGCR
jgi:hypothetical protein